MTRRRPPNGREAHISGTTPSAEFSLVNAAPSAAGFRRRFSCHIPVAPSSGPKLRLHSRSFPERCLAMSQEVGASLLSGNERGAAKMGFRGDSSMAGPPAPYRGAGTLPSVQPVRAGHVLGGPKVVEERLEVPRRLSQRQEPNVLPPCRLPGMWNQPRSVHTSAWPQTYDLCSDLNIQLPFENVEKLVLYVMHVQPRPGIWSSRNLEESEAPARICVRDFHQDAAATHRDRLSRPARARLHPEEPRGSDCAGFGLLLFGCGLGG